MKSITSLCLCLFMLTWTTSCDFLGLGADKQKNEDSIDKDSEDEDDNIEDEASDDGNDDAAGGGPISGYGLALQTGTNWKFYWYHYSHTNWTAPGYGMNPSTSIDDGYVTVTLGNQSAVAGKMMYTVGLSGDIPDAGSSSSWNETFWEYIGVDNGSLIASKDGLSVKTIIDGQTGISRHSFFGMEFPKDIAIEASVYATAAEAPVEYSTSCHSASYSYSKDDSVSIPGIYLDGDEVSLNYSDYFKPGIGPLGHKYHNYSKDVASSGDWSSASTDRKYVLISSSLAADDNFAPPLSAWQVAGDMPTVKSNPDAVLLDGVVYLMGGSASYSASTGVYRQETDGSWTQLASVPVSWVTGSSDTGATVKDGKIYLAMKYNLGTSRQMRIYSYDQATNNWMNYAQTLSEADVYDIFLWGTKLYVVCENGSHYIYDSSLKSAGFGLTDGLSYLSALSHDNTNLFVVGQYNTYGDTYTTGMFVAGNSATYGENSVWGASDSKRRWSPGLAVYDNRLYVFGGGEDEYAKKVVSCAFDESGNISGWRDHSPMLYGGTGLDALVIGDRIYVYGTDSGAKIEVYTPANDL